MSGASVESRSDPPCIIPIGRSVDTGTVVLSTRSALIEVDCWVVELSFQGRIVVRTGLLSNNGKFHDTLGETKFKGGVYLK